MGSCCIKSQIPENAGIEGTDVQASFYSERSLISSQYGGNVSVYGGSSYSGKGIPTTDSLYSSQEVGKEDFEAI